MDVNIRGAEFNQQRTHRYSLWRVWDDALPAINIIGLNPSTADENQDDPTIRRCIGFAKSWGYGSLYMTNLFGFRCTDPRGLRTADNPVGKFNDHYLRQYAKISALVVAAWGSQPSHQNFRIAEVMQVLWDVPLHAIKLTKNGYPAHPLYLPANLTPVMFRNTEDALTAT